MAICGDCGAAYDAAPPVFIRGPRAARAPRQTRRKRSEVIDTAASIFTRPSVMTPLASERAPRGARRAVVSLTSGPAAVLEDWTPAPLAAPPAVALPPLPPHPPRLAAVADVAPNVSRETMAPAPRPARRPTSPEQETRAEYDRYILALFERAQLECNSFFDDSARIAGVARPPYTAWELFTHRKTVIAKWGSDELLTFFSFNRRLSYAQFREQYRASVRSERPEQEQVS